MFQHKTDISFCLLLSFAVKIVFIDSIMFLASTRHDISLDAQTISQQQNKAFCLLFV